MHRIKEVFRTGIIYGLGSIVSKGLGFFLLPVYTAIFTVSEFGIIEMLMSISSIVSTIIVMGLHASQSFYYFQQKERGYEKQAEIISAVFSIKVVWGITFIIILALLTPTLNSWLFEEKLSVQLFMIVFIGTFFGTVVSQSVEVFRLLFRPWPYITINIINSVLMAVLILMFVLLLNMGVKGYVTGFLVASIMTAVLGVYLIRGYLRFKLFPKELIFKIIRFAVPLLPAALSMYIMITADRWFILYFKDETQLGIYAVAAKFAMIIALAIETFRQAWWPVALDAMHSDDGPRTFRMLSRLYLGFAGIGVILISLLSQLLVQWFTAEPYHESYPLVGILAWQSVFYGFYMVISAGIWKREKTAVSALLMAIFALFNVALDYILVPMYGLYGAAFTTAITFFLWCVTSIIVSERYWYIGFPYTVLLFQLLISVPTSIYAIYLLQSDMLGIQGLSISALAIMVLLFTSLSIEDWCIIAKKLKSAAI